MMFTFDGFLIHSLPTVLGGVLRFRRVGLGLGTYLFVVRIGFLLLRGTS